MFRPIRTAGLCLALLVAACEQAPPILDPHSALDLERSARAAQEEIEQIGPGVIETLRREGSARVMIALEVPATPAGMLDPAEGLEVLQQQVAAVQQGVLQEVAASELEVVRRYSAVPALAATAHSEPALRRLAADPRVRRIDLDVGGTGTLAASVPFIGADRRHDLGNEGQGVVVAVLDSGADRFHPDLAGRVLHEACFGDRDGAINGVGFCPNGSDRQFGPGAAQDDAGHGTHVSGIVAAGGVTSAPGVAPRAGIVSVKMLDNCSFAGCFYFYSEVVAALNYIIINNTTLGVQVINMSFGTGALFTGYCDNATAYNMAGAAAINTLRDMGVISFASSGNNGSGTHMPSPACLRNVVSVGATNNADVVPFFSNSNATTDIFAPGVTIRSLAIGGGTVVASGTSMASPHAAGCAALLIQAGDATTPDAIENRLKTSPVHVTDPKNGLTFPRIDCSPDQPPPPPCTPRTVDRIWSNGAPPGTIRRGDPFLYMADFNVEAYLPRAGARAADVRIGESWETGTPAQGFFLADVNNDGLRDVVVRWSMPSLIADGRVPLGVHEIEIWARDPGTEELFCASTEVTIVP